MEGDGPITLLPRLITDIRVFPKVGTHGKDRTSFPLPRLCCFRGISLGEVPQEVP